jgi:molybdate transport system substrate-binding protein
MLMRNPTRRPKVVVLFVALLCLAAPGFAQRKIRVAAASDLQTVMPQIAKSFTDQTHVSLELTYGSSGNFFAQIQNGAPFDVFFSADNEFPSRLVQSNLADPSSSVVYGIGSLVLWLPPGSKCDPQSQKWDCLLQPYVSKIALANPAHAPYGRAAVLALQSAHIYEKVRAKFVLGENVAQAAQFAQSGNAQAAILAHSQMLLPAMQSGKRWEIPRDAYPVIEQTAVILKSAKDPSAAQDFIAFITTGPGRALLEQAGFQPPPAAPPSRESHK